MPPPALLKVVYIPPGPPAIHFRAYAVEARGSTLIERILRQLQDRNEQDSTIVLCHDDADWRALKPLAATYEFPVFQSQERTLIRAVAEVAAAFRPDVVAYLSVEAAFCPSDVFRRAVELHVLGNADYTEVAGLPDGVGPEIWRAEFLMALSSADYPGDPPDPRELVSTLRSNVSELPFCVKRLDVAPPRSTPDAIRILTARDAHRAAEALCGLGAEFAFEAIDGWTEAREYLAVPMPRVPEAGERNGALQVLYVSPASGYSGAGHMLQALASALQRTSTSQAAVVGLEGVLSDRLREAGCRVLCPNSDISTDRDGNRRFAHEVLRSLRPDVIHFNSAPGEPFVTAAAEKRVPTVVHVRTAEFDALEAALAGAARVVAVSEFIRGRLLRAGLPDQMVEVVYDGVDSQALRRELLDRTSIRRNLEIPGREFVILMIARLSQQKRHDLVLEAMALLVERTRAARLLLVGDRGSTRLYNELCERIRALGLRDRVVWLPFQPDVRPLEAAADALVLYSENEALGTCVLEAMAMQLPVVVADSGGLPELVEDGVTGTIVPPGQPEALSRALLKIHTDPDEFARRAKAARLRVSEKFDIADHARRMENLLREAANLVRGATY